MGNGLNNNNEFLKKLQESVMNQSWMQELYKSNRAEQQQKIKGVFTVVAQNDLTAGDKAKLQAQAETLQEKVERLEAKMAVLAEEMAAKEEEIAKAADAIANLATEAEDKSEEMQSKHEKWVKQCVTDVFAAYKRNPESVGGKDGIAPEIKRRIKNSNYISTLETQIDGIITKLDSKKKEVDGLIADADKWITQNKILEAQYGATKSTYDLLNASIGKIGATETSYTNSDYDTAKPVYSPEKASIVSNYSENATVNVLPTNENYNPDAKQMTVADIQTKYKDYLGTKATSGVDSNSYSNAAVKNLDKAMKEGLFSDMKSAGMSYDEVTTFLANNFAGANIRKTDTNFSVPYGHGSEADRTFDTLIESLKDYNSGFRGALNTWDENAGNTISSNAQIESLSENYSAIIDDFKSNGFTFKEAMYAMFDPDCGIFKDSGVVYNVDKQSDGERGLNYFIEFAGDDETATLYENLSNKIYATWGVKPSRGADATQYEDDSVDDTDSSETSNPTTTPPTTPSRTDPIWFSLGEDVNNKYSFVVDRDQDGTFSGANEFVGGDTNSWLDDLRALDVNGDNKLSGDELKSLKILGTNFNAGDQGIGTDEYTPTKTNSSNKYTRTEETTVAYTLSNAQAMGIEEIDLSGLEGQVNQEKMLNGQEVIDVNGAKQFSDTFSFKINGETVNAFRQDEDSSEGGYMDKIYGAAYGKNFNVGLSDQEVDEVMNKDYGEYDKFAARFSQLFADINVLKGIDPLKENIKTLAQEAIDDANKLANVELTKATNKAAAMKEVSGWSSIQNEVQSIANEKGVAIDMEQAKGIYVLDNTLGANGVVEKYIELLDNEETALKNIETRKSVWEATKLGMQQGVIIDLTDAKNKIMNGMSVEEYVAEAKSLQDASIEVDVTDEDYSVNQEREDEIFNAFNDIFNAENLNEKAVDALARLCEKQIDSEIGEKIYSEGVTGEDLAKKIGKEFGIE